MQITFQKKKPKKKKTTVPLCIE